MKNIYEEMDEILKSRRNLFEFNIFSSLVFIVYNKQGVFELSPRLEFHSE